MIIILQFEKNERLIYHFGLLDDLTRGDIPSLYSDLVLLKFTMLKIIL